MGDIVVSIVAKKMVFANFKAVRQSEFYQAHALGLKPDKTFEIRSIEYDGEDYVKHKGKNYSVLRTYDKGEIMEIVCEGVVNNATT